LTPKSRRPKQILRPKSAAAMARRIFTFYYIGIQNNTLLSVIRLYRITRDFDSAGPTENTDHVDRKTVAGRVMFFWIERRLADRAVLWRETFDNVTDETIKYCPIGKYILYTLYRYSTAFFIHSASVRRCFAASVLSVEHVWRVREEDLYIDRYFRAISIIHFSCVL